MHGRRSIRIALFVALLAACPIVVYVAGRHFRDSVGLLALAALILFIGSAIVLRSLVIFGAMAVFLGSSLAGPAAHHGIPNDQEVVEGALIFPILGAIAGWICHVTLMSESRCSKSNQDGRLRGTIAVVTTLVLAGVFAVVGKMIWDAIAGSDGGSFTIPPDFPVLFVAVSIVWAVLASLGFRSNHR